jgi:hypothetical protein
LQVSSRMVPLKVMVSAAAVPIQKQEAMSAEARGSFMVVESFCVGRNDRGGDP